MDSSNSRLQIEIQGGDAVSAAEALLSIEGLEGSYQTVDEVERELNIATIANIVSIAAETMTIAKKLYQWVQKYQKSRQDLAGGSIDKVLIVASNGRRLLLKDATVDQIKQILEN